MIVAPSFPRELAPGIYWLGACIPTHVNGVAFHGHVGQFLLVGEASTLLVDTGIPRDWKVIEAQLTKVLGARELDYLFVTHPEPPHSAALPNILDRYPGCRVVGDITDYHLYFPDYQHRLAAMTVGEEIDLGRLRFRFIEAVLKDLPNTLWGYETTERVMFVSDGFSFVHRDTLAESHDEIVHRPEECAMTSAELPGGVNLEHAAFILLTALYWSQFVDPEALFEEVEAVLRENPSRMIAPAHGNVIVDPDVVLPIIRKVHERAFENRAN